MKDGLGNCHEGIQRFSQKDTEAYLFQGVNFIDIFPIFQNAVMVDQVVKSMVDACLDLDIDGIVGLESRGFLFAVLLAKELKLPFYPIRKKGKLPGKVILTSFDKEYGYDELEIQTELSGKILLVDDLLATGGSIAAAIKLIKAAGASPAKALFLVELTKLDGKSVLQKENVPYNSLVKINE